MSSAIQIAAQLGRAVQLHQAGRLGEAEAEYLSVLKKDRRNGDALNLLGAIAQARGLKDQALAYFNKAVDALPQSAIAFFNRANLLAELDQSQKALHDYRRAIALNAGYADARLNYGALLYKMNELPSAIAAFREMTLRCAADPRGFYNLGRCLIEDKNNTEAEANLKKAINLSPKYLDALIALAKLYENSGQLPEAIATVRNAIGINGKNGEHYSTLGNLLLATGAFDEGIQAHLAACATDPQRPEFLFNLGNTYRGAGKRELAEEAYRRAIEVGPSFIDAYVNLGQVLVDRGAVDEGLELFDRVLALGNGDSEDLVKVVATHKSAVLTNRALALLGEGRFTEGWEAYRLRFSFPINAPLSRALALPEWRGEPIADKTLFLWTDQGLGDDIIYSSMIPDALAKAKSCILECDARLLPIFRRSFPTMTVLPRQDPPVAEIAAFKPDVQSSVADLGGILRPETSSFPSHLGYLAADQEQTKKMRQKYSALAKGRPIVGISWRSESLTTGKSKTLPLENWDSIITSPDVFFISLQYGACDDDIAKCRERTGVDIFHDTDFNPMRDLDSFASQVAAMDLIISVSNTTVHFAGALNQPVWTLVPNGTGSLWYFRHGETTPWYPAMRLFRQPQPGDWSGVADRVAAELRSWVDAFRSS